METIAGVFYNRLEQGMKLQSSVTVCYALYDDFNDPQDCETNAEVESPYNTYLNEGLPIGPILNPEKKPSRLYFLQNIQIICSLRRISIIRLMVKSTIQKHMKNIYRFAKN